MNLYVPVNLSSGLGGDNYYILGEEALAHAYLDAAVEQLADVLHDHKDHDLESVNVFRLEPVNRSELLPILVRAMALRYAWEATDGSGDLTEFWKLGLRLNMSAAERHTLVETWLETIEQEAVSE